jgi:4a-hydroxytetrahydrobiopterin dehydratase
MKTNWIEFDNSMERNFEFDTFQDALKFVNKVGQLAEIQNHHPDILMYEYKKVKITLKTVDAGMKITPKDYRLAQGINRLSQA